MMDRIIDTDLISHVEPHWARGYEKGFTHEQTAEAANDTYCELERFYDRFSPHKWPEEKPECYTWVLIKRNGFFGEAQHHVAWYAKDGKFYVTGFDESADAVTHWWHLPEVKE
jgi:hypothetical protein